MAIVASRPNSVGSGLTSTGAAPGGQPPAPAWQQIVKRAVRDPAELLRRLDLPPPPRNPDGAHRQFHTFVPEPYLSRIRPGDARDPLLLQVLPQAPELDDEAGFLADPVGDLASLRRPGLIHKYHGRALLLASGACAVHCRYCFRRHFPYQSAAAAERELEGTFGELATDLGIREVILSGGDPLMMTDQRFRRLVARLATLEQLTRLRIHTRLPIVIPQRVTGKLVESLSGLRLKVVVVLHANHPREIDGDVMAATARLAGSGALLLNQSVLLRGVNDDEQTLIELSERLIAAGVLPYYLHQLDRVRGAAHFEVPVKRGKTLMAALRRALPGYAVPRYVREDAGAPAKTVLA